MLATNAYTPALYPGLRRTVIPILLWQGFTRPLTEEERLSILPGRLCFTDLRKSGGFARLSPDHRLTLGGAVFRAASHRGYGEWHGRHRLSQLFPQLRDIRVDCFWEGACALTDAALPAIQRLEPDVYSLIGFSTRGVVLAQTLGREMGLFLAGQKTEAEMPVRVGGLLPIALQPVKSFLGGFAFPAYQLRDALRLT